MTPINYAISFFSAGIRITRVSEVLRFYQSGLQDQPAPDCEAKQQSPEDHLPGAAKPEIDRAYR